MLRHRCPAAAVLPLARRAAWPADSGFPVCRPGNAADEHGQLTREQPATRPALSSAAARMAPPGLSSPVRPTAARRACPSRTARPGCQRIEPAQVPAESGGVSVLRGGDGVVGCCRERGKPDSRGTFRRRHRGGQRHAPGGLCLGGQLSGLDALSYVRWGEWLTLLFQVMPVFFLVGGYANALSWTSHHEQGESRTRWVRDRAMRLLWPTGVYVILAVLAITSARLAAVSLAEIAEAGSLVALQLWFLPVYLLLVALTPVMLAAHRRWGLAVPAVMAAAAALVDVGVIGLHLHLIGCPPGSGQRGPGRPCSCCSASRRPWSAWPGSRSRDSPRAGTCRRLSWRPAAPACSRPCSPAAPRPKPPGRKRSTLRRRTSPPKPPEPGIRSAGPTAWARGHPASMRVILRTSSLRFPAWPGVGLPAPLVRTFGPFAAGALA